MRSRRTRVIHFPTSYTGNAWALSRGERRHGIESDVLVADTNPLGYPADRMLSLRPRIGWRSAVANALRVGTALPRLLARYNVYHCNGGQAFFPHFADLPLYRARGRVFVTFNGSDARQRDRLPPDHPFVRYPDADPLYLDGSRDARAREHVAASDRNADGIFAVTPDLLGVLPARARLLPAVIPTWDRLAPTYPDTIPRRIVIAHAPSNRGLKGTKYVLAALEEIQALYPDRIEVLLIEGVSNEEALAMLSRAHLLIDQVLLGWYGAVAVEAMRMGIPVAAYIDRDALARVPGPMAADLVDTVIRADPATLTGALLEVLDDPDRLLDLSVRARAYVERWHDPVVVAGITTACYAEAA